MNVVMKKREERRPRLGGKAVANHKDQLLDVALADTFPASDPVASLEPNGAVADPEAESPPERDLGRDERIRRRAYEIWARAGHPANREVEHWAQAEQEIDEEDRAHGDLPASARSLATGHE